MKNRIVQKTNVYVCMILIFLLASCAKEPQTVQQSTIENSYIIDIYNPAEVAGFADYVFVGFVNEKGDTEYHQNIDPALLDGLEIEKDPYTNYTFTVLENLKGNLKQGAMIPAQKEGGLSEDGSRLRLEEGDFLPEAGETLIVFITVQEDGTLLFSGKNDSFRLLDAAHAGEDYKNLEIYKTIADACENEIFFDRERNTAAEQYLG